VQFEGLSYPSTEHAFQAAKTTNPRLRRAIRDVATPGSAKKMGASLTLRTDWESVKLGVMLEFLRQKFGQPLLRGLLLKTGQAQLVEGNTWGDTYWGAIEQEGRWVGQNRLGILLMQVRDELQQPAPVKT
jgi:ribA/ribD-fused uncharacterized protein